MIWALEAHERFDRPTCSECSDALRKRRGCHKPGFDVEGSMAYRSTSPELYNRDKRDGEPDKHTLLRTCPVGEVLREAPYVYDAISAQGYADAGALNPLTLPIWGQHAIRVVSSERARLQKMADEQRKNQRNARA